MCMRQPRIPTAAPPLIAAPDNQNAIAQSDLEARMRKRRAGAAADILTGPTGFGSMMGNGGQNSGSPTLGGR